MLVIILTEEVKTCTSCVQMRLRVYRESRLILQGVCAISTAANRHFISAHSVIYACVCESEEDVLIKAHGELKRTRGPISRNYAFH